MSESFRQHPEAQCKHRWEKLFLETCYHIKINQALNQLLEKGTLCLNTKLPNVFNNVLDHTGKHTHTTSTSSLNLAAKQEVQFLRGGCCKRGFSLTTWECFLSHNMQMNRLPQKSVWQWGLCRRPQSAGEAVPHLWSDMLLQHHLGKQHSLWYNLLLQEATVVWSSNDRYSCTAVGSFCYPHSLSLQSHTHPFQENKTRLTGRVCCL